MIRILAEDHDTHTVKRRRIERTKDVFPFRKTRYPRIFAFYEVYEFCPIRLLELSCESGIPGWMDIDCHICHRVFILAKKSKENPHR
jgi:hypothetical protein